MVGEEWILEIISKKTKLYWAQVFYGYNFELPIFYENSYFLRVVRCYNSFQENRACVL